MTLSPSSQNPFPNIFKGKSVTVNFGSDGCNSTPKQPTQDINSTIHGIDTFKPSMMKLM
jgi:hypothetical protein